MAGLYVASNPTALGAQFTLQRNMGAFSDTLTRLSTGLRINSAKDDPAGLIASELLKSDIVATNKAITNTERANSVLAVADSALGQISALLNDIRGLVVESANTGAMSDSQIAANQLQVDASIDAIDRIARTTNYQGQKLLDGSLDFTTDAGIAAESAGISNLNIQAANFGTADSVAVNVKVLEAAKKGTLIYNGTGVDQTTTIDVTGSAGSKSFTFGAGTTTREMATAINAASDSTGVTARVEGEASRGTTELNGVGANNSIVITAKEEGFDAGNYTFRIVQGEKNDAYVVSEATGSKPGVVEISLEKSYETNINGFIGMFDITMNTGGDSTAPTSVSITRGNVNRAYLASADTNASATSTDGLKTLNVTSAGENGTMSNLNGWTVKLGTMAAGAADDPAEYDFDAKTITIHAQADAANAANQATYFNRAISTALNTLTGTTGAVAADQTIVATTGTLALGDSFTLDGGAAQGELVVTYKSGATAEDIQKLMNDVSGVQASLAGGVKGTDVILDVPAGPTHVDGGIPMASKYVANATANDVANLIKEKLGDRFDVALKTGDTGDGRMTYMDASVSHGSVNMDNAIRFTGMDDGPVVRLSTMNEDGTPILNQQLGVTLINPTETDIRNGLTVPVLQINLATDASGNSITTAQDIVDLFNSLTPEQTGGVSASLILPDGVDPNGRTWVVDECDNVSVLTDCNAVYGQGIVQPTGVAGTCEITENDLVLLGNNQMMYDTNAIGRIPNAAPTVHTGNSVAGTGTGETVNGLALSISTAGGADDTNGGSILNGVTIVLKTSADDNSTGSFDSKTGTLTVEVANDADISAANALGTVLATVISANTNAIFNQIKAYNGSAATAIGTITNNALAGATTPDIVFGPAGSEGVAVTMSGGATKGDVIETQAKVTLRTDATTAADGTATKSIALSTDKMTSALNGVGFRFTTDSSQAGFNKEDGFLTVYLNPATQALAAGSADFQREVNEAINGAVHDNWEGIREYTKTTDTGATVSMTIGTAVGLTDLLGLGTNDFNTLRFASSTEAGPTPGAVFTQTRGVSVSDPALLIEAIKTGPEMAGTKIALIQDDTLPASSTTAAHVAVEYDETTGTLTIRANGSALQSGTDGGINAQLLADALNNNDVFKQHFTATAPSNNTLGSAATTTAVVNFGSDTKPKATMSGGYGIKTDDNLINPRTGTSSGLTMTGNVDDNQRLVLEATETGSKNFVKVYVAQGSFNTYCPLGLRMNELAGTDVVATINGMKATASGNNVSINNADLAMSMTVGNEVGESNFNITGGGSTFQLGPDVVSTQQIRIALPNVTSTHLGGTSGMLFQLRSGMDAALNTDTKLADRIVGEAIDAVTTARGRLGAIQRSTLDPNVLALQDNLEALSEAEAMLTNADFAEEASNMARYQILVQAGANVLAQANQLPQYAAMLIG